MNRADLVSRDKRYVWHPYTAMQSYVDGTDPLVISAAEGSFLYDVDGTRYLDANGSWWVSAFGHRHPTMVRALVEQANALPHCSLAGCTHEPAALLAEQLVALAPGALASELGAERKLEHVFYSDNGSTAVEVAVKMAVQYWLQNGRPARTRFVTLEHAFHGETVGATSVGGLDVFRSMFGSILFDVVRVPSPSSGWERCVEAIATVLATEGDTIAGVVLEPLVQGAGGMLVHPPEFLRAVRELCLRADTFLVIDEVFTGFGRTGTAFACDQAGVVPDLLCLAKALSGGMMPFAATLATRRIYDGFLGDRSRAFYYGHSYCGNPLGARVALAALQVFHDEKIVEQVVRKAPRVRERFERIAANVPGARNARSCGLVGALDLGGGGYLAEAGWKVYAAARRRGVYLRPLGDVVYIAPALNIPDDVLDELLDVVEGAVSEAVAGG